MGCSCNFPVKANLLNDEPTIYRWIIHLNIPKLTFFLSGKPTVYRWFKMMNPRKKIVIWCWPRLDSSYHEAYVLTCTDGLSARPAAGRLFFVWPVVTLVFRGTWWSWVIYMNPTNLYMELLWVCWLILDDLWCFIVLIYHSHDMQNTSSSVRHVGVIKITVKMWCWCPFQIMLMEFDSRTNGIV